MLWLGIIAEDFYHSQINNLLKTEINWAAAISFYFLFAFGIVFFCVLPALHKKSGLEALMRGALLGIVSYGAYDLTNLATLKNWSILVSLVDLAWGTTLASIASVTTYFASNRLVHSKN